MWKLPLFLGAIATEDSFPVDSYGQGPVPIIVANAVTMPLVYCFDIAIKGLHFSAVSLGGKYLTELNRTELNLP